MRKILLLLLIITSLSTSIKATNLDSLKRNIPFVRNDKFDEGLININIEKTALDLKTVIENNGNDIQQKENHKSYLLRATQIIKDGLFLLNKKHNTNASYLIKDNKTEIQVIINLPIIKQK